MTIPASGIVEVLPSVLAAGGTGLNGIGLMLTDDARVPIGQVLSFPNEDAVEGYFGPGSYKAGEAGIYFTGPTGAAITPNAPPPATPPEPRADASSPSPDTHSAAHRTSSCSSLVRA